MLTAALAAYTSVSPDAITVGAGADEILDMLPKALGAAGDPVALSRPPSAIFRSASETAGGRVDAAPAAGLDLDKDRFLGAARHARLTWLCNPNNPTGELLPVGFIEKLAEASPGVVAVDEAYFEFSGVTAVGLIARFPNLVLIRTLSKAFGLAGVRVGYSLRGPRSRAAPRPVRPPGSISVVSEGLGVHAVRDQHGMRQRVSSIVGSPENLYGELARLPPQV